MGKREKVEDDADVIVWLMGCGFAARP